jgi:hypothetical protein
VLTQVEFQMHATGFDLFTWAASFTGNVLLAIVLFVRGRARSFPFFSLYILFQAVDNIVSYFVIRASLGTYQHYYWSVNVLEEVLKLLVFYEVAVHVFRPTGVWARDIRKTFIGLVCLSFMVASLLTWLAQPTAPRFIETVVLRGNFFSAVMLSELCVGMVVLSGTVGLPWKTHVARIAQGLGTYSLVRLGTGVIQNALGIHPGSHTFMRSSYASDLTYIVCCFYWIVTLYAEAPAPRELPEAMRMQIYTLQKQVENDLARIRDWRNG